jgi:uncharacterized protein YidB (DUF937 family)
MGLFDAITRTIFGELSGSETGPVADQVMSALQQHGIGDASGLVSQLEQSGLGAHVASWVNEGQNLPITPDQVQAALGTPAIASIAAKFGVDPETASQMLSQHLPGIVSHLAQNQPAPDTPPAST